MADISVVWNGVSADWVVINSGLLEEDELQTAVLLSLFTDRAALPDDPLPTGADDRRGWWGDAMLGSRLWLLRRAKQTTETLTRAKDYIIEALSWVIDDGIALRVDVLVSWQKLEFLAAQIAIVRNDGTSLQIKFAWAWAKEPRVSLPQQKIIKTVDLVDQQSIDLLHTLIRQTYPEWFGV